MVLCHILLTVLCSCPFFTKYERIAMSPAYSPWAPLHGEKENYFWEQDLVVPKNKISQICYIAHFQILKYYILQIKNFAVVKIIRRKNWQHWFSKQFTSTPVHQSRSPGGVLLKRGSSKIRKIHRKTPVLESYFW